MHHNNRCQYNTSRLANQEIHNKMFVGTNVYKPLIGQQGTLSKPLTSYKRPTRRYRRQLSIIPPTLFNLQKQEHPQPLYHELARVLNLVAAHSPNHQANQQPDAPTHQ